MTLRDQLKYPEIMAQQEMREVTKARMKREEEDQEILNQHLRNKDVKKEIKQ